MIFRPRAKLDDHLKYLIGDISAVLILGIGAVVWANNEFAKVDERFDKVEQTLIKIDAKLYKMQGDIADLNATKKASK